MRKVDESIPDKNGQVSLPHFWKMEGQLDMIGLNMHL